MSPNALVELLVMVPRPFVVLVSSLQPGMLPVVSRVAAPWTLPRLQMAPLVQLRASVASCPTRPLSMLVKPRASVNPRVSLEVSATLLDRFTNVLTVPFVMSRVTLATMLSPVLKLLVKLPLVPTLVAPLVALDVSLNVDLTVPLMFPTSGMIRMNVAVTLTVTSRSFDGGVWRG